MRYVDGEEHASIGAPDDARAVRHITTLPTPPFTLR
jgi:hypothetical protein